jgi:EAL domain-containing protein (putative c-di-GMP-specific phosphodiesterase class I)
MGAPSYRTATYATGELADAIAAGQIHVHYQPKLDVRTGLPKGVEALARWRHPTLGAIPPDDFIPHAEAEALIGALSLSVIDQALAQTAYWNSRGLRLTVAVNLSPKVLDRPMLVEEISTLVERHGLRSEQLILEITETSVVSFLGVALGVLARLRLKGFGLSLDDYGTGFSSMQQLARIPFTELKIDRSLVNGAHERPYLQVILQSALDMTRGLRMTSVAEGIETEADWHLLQSLGCTLGQGYFIARPMSGDAIPTWLKGHQAKLPILRETGR